MTRRTRTKYPASRAPEIEENTDIERDYILETPKGVAVEVEVIKDFSTGYDSRNGGGDLIITDSDLPMIDVRPVDGPEVIKVEPTASRDKGPAQIVFEAAVAFFRRLIFCPSRCSSC